VACEREMSKAVFSISSKNKRSHSHVTRTWNVCILEDTYIFMQYHGQVAVRIFEEVANFNEDKSNISDGSSRYMYVMHTSCNTHHVHTVHKYYYINIIYQVYAYVL
jgi:hypothetical protein